MPLPLLADDTPSRAPSEPAAHDAEDAPLAQEAKAVLTALADVKTILQSQVNYEQVMSLAGLYRDADFESEIVESQWNRLWNHEMHERLCGKPIVVVPDKPPLTKPQLRDLAWLRVLEKEHYDRMEEDWYEEYGDEFDANGFVVLKEEVSETPSLFPPQELNFNPIPPDDPEGRAAYRTGFLADHCYAPSAYWRLTYTFEPPDL